MAEVSNTQSSWLASASFGGALLALGSAVCCVLPMGLMLVGLGGAWLSVFAPIAAFAVYLLSASVVLIVIAWGITLRQHAPRHVFYLLIFSSVTTALAAGIYWGQVGLNDYLISWM